MHYYDPLDITFYAMGTPPTLQKVQNTIQMSYKFGDLKMMVYRKEYTFKSLSGCMSLSAGVRN